MDTASNSGNVHLSSRSTFPGTSGICHFNKTDLRISCYQNLLRTGAHKLVRPRDPAASASWGKCMDAIFDPVNGAGREFSLWSIPRPQQIKKFKTAVLAGVLHDSAKHTSKFSTQEPTTLAEDLASRVFQEKNDAEAELEKERSKARENQEQQQQRFNDNETSMNLMPGPPGVNAPSLNFELNDHQRHALGILPSNPQSVNERFRNVRPRLLDELSGDNDTNNRTDRVQNISPDFEEDQTNSNAFVVIGDNCYNQYYDLDLLAAGAIIDLNNTATATDGDQVVEVIGIGGNGGGNGATNAMIGQNGGGDGGTIDSHGQNGGDDGANNAIGGDQVRNVGNLRNGGGNGGANAVNVRNGGGANAANVRNGGGANAVNVRNGGGANAMNVRNGGGANTMNGRNGGGDRGADAVNGRNGGGNRGTNAMNGRNGGGDRGADAVNGRNGGGDRGANAVNGRNGGGDGGANAVNGRNGGGDRFRNGSGNRHRQRTQRDRMDAASHQRATASRAAMGSTVTENAPGSTPRHRMVDSVDVLDRMNSGMLDGLSMLSRIARQTRVSPSTQELNQIEQALSQLISRRKNAVEAGASDQVINRIDGKIEKLTKKYDDLLDKMLEGNGNEGIEDDG